MNPALAGFPLFFLNITSGNKYRRFFAGDALSVTQPTEVNSEGRSRLSMIQTLGNSNSLRVIFKFQSAKNADTKGETTENETSDVS